MTTGHWLAELKNTLNVSHEDGKMVWSGERTWKQNTMDPTGPTYQVISVLLHCLTAEKHKTREDGVETMERLLFLGSNRDESQQKRSHVTTLPMQKKTNKNNYWIIDN